MTALVSELDDDVLEQWRHTYELAGRRRGEPTYLAHELRIAARCAPLAHESAHAFLRLFHELRRGWHAQVGAEGRKGEVGKGWERGVGVRDRGERMEEERPATKAGEEEGVQCVREEFCRWYVPIYIISKSRRRKGEKRREEDGVEYTLVGFLKVSTSVIYTNTIVGWVSGLDCCSC